MCNAEGTVADGHITGGIIYVERAQRIESAVGSVRVHEVGVCAVIADYKLSGTVAEAEL